MWRDPVRDQPKAGARVLVVEAGCQTPRFAEIEALSGTDLMVAVIENYPEQYNRRVMKHLSAWMEIPEVPDTLRAERNQDKNQDIVS